MATPRILARLEEIVGQKKHQSTDIRFILRNWDDAPNAAHRVALNWIKIQTSLPVAFQQAVIEATDKAISVLHDMHPKAQAMICTSYKDDIPALISKAVNYTKIDDLLWKRISLAVKREELPAARAKRLARRDDAPAALKKLVGVSDDDDAPVRKSKASDDEAPVRSSKKKVVKIESVRKKKIEPEDHPHVAGLKERLAAFIEEGTNSSARKAAKYADRYFDDLGLSEKLTDKLDDALEADFDPVQCALFCKSAAVFFKLEGAAELKTSAKPQRRADDPGNKPAGKKGAIAKVKEVFKPAKKIRTKSEADDDVDEFLEDDEKVSKVVRRVRRPNLSA